MVTLTMVWPTCGGLQFWSDVRIADGWRIQRHAAGGHCRLLDTFLLRRASGTLADCVAELQRRHPRTAQAKAARPGVLLLHGIGRTRHSMFRLARSLRVDGFDAQAVAYASTRLPIEAHGDDLAQVVEHWHPEHRVSLVGFSMGGLVIRSYLARHGCGRVDRVLFIGTPHHGAEMADYLSRWPLYRWLYGQAGIQLTTGGEGIRHALPPIPDVPFGVIAGGTGSTGYSPILAGDNDGTVTVDSVKLAGAADFVQVRAPHTFLAAAKPTRRYVTNYLRTGHFAEGNVSS